MRVSNKKVRAAYHEAGHVVTRYLLTGNIDQIESVDIIKEDGRHGICKSNKDAYELAAGHSIFEDILYCTVDGFKVIFNEVCFSLGGGVSEMLYCGLKRLPRRGMSGDFDSVYAVLDKTLPVSFGKTGIAYYPALNSLIETCLHFLKSLLANCEAKIIINAIAEALLEHETIDGDALRSIIAGFSYLRSVNTADLSWLKTDPSFREFAETGESTVN